MVDGVSIGVGLILAALFLVLLIQGFLRLLPRPQSQIEVTSSPSASFKSQTNDAIVVVQVGGRVEYMNELARQRFGLIEDEPAELERLARRVRPPEEFLELCVNEGHKRLSINGRLIDATSYRVPGYTPLILISLRSLDIATAMSGDENARDTGTALRVISEFGQTVHGSLRLDPTLLAIFQGVSRLVSTDVMEIKLYDALELNRTVRYEETADGPRLSAVARSQFGWYTDALLEKRQPVFLTDGKETATSNEKSATRERTLVKSYIGIPFLVDGDLVSTLELGQTATSDFSEQDFELLKLVTGQAAIALRNARRYESEQGRISELTGLTRLAQAASSIQEQQELFTRLVETIAPLFNVEIVGFLLYNENDRELEGQVPFQGLPVNVVNVYHSVLLPGSQGEETLKSAQMIMTPNAPRDDSIRALGLAEIAQLASIRETVLMPLVSNGHVVGYLQLANHRGGTAAFTNEELRLANSISGQAATIIENAVLIQQARQRGQRSESLRRIASLVASSATLDEILQFSVQELAELLKADVASIYLLHPQSHELRLHNASAWGVTPEMQRRVPRIEVSEAQLRRTTVSGTQRPFISGRLSADERVSAAYRDILETVIIESCIIVPLMARERSVGELMLGSRKADYFNSYDLQVLSTAAGLLAAAVEGAVLLAQTDESLRRRVEQLTSITHVTRELNSSLDVNQLLEVIHEQSLQTTRADCGTILLFDPDSNPSDPRVTFSLGCVEEPLSPLTRRVLASGEPVLVSDFESALLNPPHLDVNSAMAAPILHQGRVRGVVHLHASRSDYFDQSSLETIQILALQAAIALGNAERYQEQYKQAEQLRRRASTLSHFAQLTSVINYEQPLEQSLLNIASAIQEATPFQVALVSVYEPESGMLRRVAGVGIPEETLAELLERKQPLQSLQQLLRPEFKVGRVHFIPADQTPVIPADVHTVLTVQAAGTINNNPNAWNDEDFVICLLEDPTGKPLGLLSVDAPRNNMRPDRATLETVEIFASQCSLAILSQSKFRDLRERIDSLTSGLQRQQRLLSISQNDLPILLRKDLEQTIAVQDLERRTRRIRAGLAIAETVSRQADSASALLALGREVLTQLGMSTALIAEETVDGPRLLHILGSVPKSTNVDALFGQRNPLRAAIQTGETIIVPNLDENDEWRDSGLLTALRSKGMICLPLTIEKQTVAGLLAVSPEPLAGLTEEDSQVYYQIARQTSVVLQNMSLLNETRRRLQEVNLLLDFSRQLSNLNPEAIVRSLLESARRVLPAAHAGSVLLWDSQSLRLVPRTVAGYADSQGLKSLTYAPGEALPGAVYASGRPRRVDEVNFTRDYPLSAEALLQYRQGTGGRLPISSLLIPIVAGEQGLGVLVLDNFNTPAAFKAGDETLLVSLAQQVALSLENVRLVQATQERAGQLQALNNVAATITSSLQSRELIGSLLDQLEPVLPYDTATLWLREKDNITVSAARGFPDTEPRTGITASVTDSALFRQMIRTGQPILVGDVRDDSRFPALEAPRLSWLGIPLMAKGEVIGLIALEKWQANFYNNESMQVATTFASQAAVALENARLFEDSVNRAAELDQRSQRLALLNRFSSALSGLLDSEQIIELAAQETLNALNALRVSLVGFERGKFVLKSVLPRTRRMSAKDVPASPVLDRLRETHGVYTSDNVAEERELASLREFLGVDTASLMIISMGSSEGQTLLLVHGGAGSRFGLNEIELARTLGNQASISLENTRLYQSTVRTAERLAILNQASSEISSSLDPEEIYVFIHRAAQRLMPMDGFVIALLDKEAQDIEGVFLIDDGERIPRSRIPLESGLSGQVIASGEPLLIHTEEESNELGAVDLGTEGNTPRSIIAVPMVLGNETIGVLSTQSYQPHVYTQDDVQILSTLANQAIVAIQNGRLFAETQRLAEELEQRVIERTAQLQREQQSTETLLRILTEVSSSLDLDRALNRTLALLNEAIGAEQGTIMLLHPDDNKLHFRAGYGYLTSQAVAESRTTVLKVGEGLAGWVVQNREGVLVDDLHLDPRWVRAASGTREHRSAIVAPMLVGEDVIGVLMAFHRQSGNFSPETLNLVRAIASQVAVAINNAHLYELIRDQAERLGTMLRKEQEEASRSQAILEAVADGVLVTGLNNRITFLNSSAQSILRMKMDEVMGRSLDAFGGLFGSAAGTWTQTIQNWSEEPGSYQGETYAEQIELEDKRIVLVHLAPVMLQNDFLGTVSIFRDITHEVEVDRLKSEFVATVSHELRTPMTSIRGYADILLMGAAGALNENQSHFLSIIKSNTERLNILVNDLLDISRIEAGRVTLTPQPLDLREVAEDVLADIMRRSQEENKPMDITLEASKDLPRVFGDSERVRQIIDNLVDNAYHYTPVNGQIQVHLFVPEGSKEVQVDVHDTGVGIAPEDQARVFDRFFRGEHPLVLATPGTGLGLPIVRQLVEMHNGRIWMTSKGIPGEGSTFSFTLPTYNNSGGRGKNG